MATRYISSPGVQISESDQTLLISTELGTTVFMTGFAAQGPTDEVTQIGSVTEFESIFGAPTNAQERYLYHSARQVLTQSPAKLLITRIPYGAGEGEGYASSYSALVYPISATLRGRNTSDVTFTDTSVQATTYAGMNGYISSFLTSTILGIGLNGAAFLNNVATSATSAAYVAQMQQIRNTYATSVVYTSSVATVQGEEIFTLNISGVYQEPVTYEQADTFHILEPTSVILSDAEYEFIVGGGLTWASKYDLANTGGAINSFSQMGSGGLIIVNPSKISVNSLYEGYYIGIADNSNISPASDFDAIHYMEAANGNNGFKQYFTNIPESRLNFALSADYRSPKNSISESLEQLPTGFDFGQAAYKDSLVIASYKIKTSIYGDTVTLDYKIDQPLIGSLYSKKTQNNPLGGTASTFFLQNLADAPRSHMKLYVNPFISSKGSWTNPDGSVAKTVRVAPAAKKLYSQGVFTSSTNADLNDVGNIPAKLSRNLTRIRDLDVEVDIIAEAGLGTIWAGAKNNPRSNPSLTEYYFDEDFPMPTSVLAALQNTSDAGQGYVAGYSNLKDAYLSIANLYYETAEAQDRRDHMFILDPLRYIFVNGPNTKVSAKKNYDFSREVYNSLKNLFGSIPSQYGAAYANWIKNNDTAADKLVWLPSSGYVAADIAYSSAISFPWSAPAGFTRGVLRNVIDLAINPTQKQRDYLYKMNLNPIAFFPGDGYVIFGQKTLFNQPSAFDRINVRRLFLALEKATKRLLKFYIFEPNSFSTRVRLVNALKPLFEQAKNNDGVYDYRIICDERNNTPDVIDNNELKIAIYIQPTRTAEFILAEFIGTRTGVNLNELVP